MRPSAAELVATIVLFCEFLTTFSKHYVDEPCKWKSLTGASYNLQPLTITDPEQPSYFIKDGDIPCTPAIEPTYSYVWNLCAPITAVSLPAVCTQSGVAGSQSTAVQYLNRSKDGYKECEMIGQYDPSTDDLHFQQLDHKDSSVGVSITYPLGDKCGASELLRSATVDVLCSDVEAEVESATEEVMCAYHFTMKSYYGCPTTCPITSNGLCNSHGHCAHDAALNRARCFCNEGYTVGDSCESDDAIGTGLSDNVTQITILMVLLLVTLVLTIFMCFLAYKVHTFREEQASKMAINSSSNSSSGSSSSSNAMNDEHGAEMMTRNALHQMRATAIASR